jgi:hypothetical protein
MRQYRLHLYIGDGRALCAAAASAGAPARGAVHETPRFCTNGGELARIASECLT